jgi:hypothetical protein
LEALLIKLLSPFLTHRCQLRGSKPGFVALIRPALASIKKHAYWVGLAVLGALITAAAFVAPGRISQMELEREALIAAIRCRGPAR